MNYSATGKPPVWYWVVAVLAFLWMLFGVFAWFMDFLMTETVTETMSEAQLQVYEARPQWLFIVYAIAIFSGLLGAVALLLRKSWATLMFTISLIAVVVQFGYTFTAMNALELLGPSALVFPFVIFAIGVFLLWFSMHTRKRGWIGG